MRDFRLSLDEILVQDAAELRLRGAEDPEDGSQEQVDEDQSQEDKGQSSEDSDGKEKDGEKGKESGDQGKQYTLEQAQRKIAALTDEKDRHETRRRQAEEKVTTLETELRELKEKGIDDEGKAELQSLRTQVAQLTTDLQDQKLENEFFKANSYKWHNPAAALRLADLSDVEIDKSGKVTGLQAALEKLATDEPWLLAKEAEEDSEDGKPAPKKSGTPPKRKEQQDDAASRQAKTSKFQQKYPGLRR